MLNNICMLIILGMLIILFVQKMGHLEKEYGKLIEIVGSMKFKQFEHERQLLERDGVYVPEDTAEYVYNILWGTINEGDKKVLEKEYKEKCPAHIPMWKFVLYNYRVTTSIVRKEPMAKLSCAEAVISNEYESESAIRGMNKIRENIKNVENEFRDIVNQVDEVKDIKD
nr:hypothetical protein [uncultured Cellulosilyticum sp.]